MNNAASIKARLNNLAFQIGKPGEYILQHYMIERLLYRLSISRYADDFILKGGLLLHVLFEERSRATRDIDLLAQSVSNSPEAMMGVFKEICAIPVDDAVTYDADRIMAQAITEDADYHGVRIKLTGYIERSRSALQFDIGFGDVIIPAPEKMVYPSLLGMDEINLLVYSKESVIAEKFQAMVYLAQANSRMKDFYDIYMIAVTYEFDASVLREAVRETVRRRNTPMPDIPAVFSDSFASFSGKSGQWSAFCKRLNLSAIPFEQVLHVIRDFLSPVYRSIHEGKDFQGHWFCSEQRWEL